MTLPLDSLQLLIGLACWGLVKLREPLYKPRVWLDPRPPRHPQIVNIIWSSIILRRCGLHDYVLHQTSLQRKEQNVHTWVPMAWKEARRHPWFQRAVHLHIHMIDVMMTVWLYGLPTLARQHVTDSNFVTSQINESNFATSQLKRVKFCNKSIVTSQFCNKCL